MMKGRKVSELGLNVIGRCNDGLCLLYLIRVEARNISILRTDQHPKALTSRDQLLTKTHKSSTEHGCKTRVLINSNGVEEANLCTDTKRIHVDPCRMTEIRFMYGERKNTLLTTRIA